MGLFFVLESTDDTIDNAIKTTSSTDDVDNEVDKSKEEENNNTENSTEKTDNENNNENDESKTDNNDPASEENSTENDPASETNSSSEENLNDNEEENTEEENEQQNSSEISPEVVDKEKHLQLFTNLKLVKEKIDTTVPVLQFKTDSLYISERIKMLNLTNELTKTSKYIDLIIGENFSSYNTDKLESVVSLIMMKIDNIFKNIERITMPKK